MTGFVIHGGKPLAGRVTIGGYKHSFVQFVAAAVATGTRITVTNVPAVSEVTVLGDILRALGASLTADGCTVDIDARTVHESSVPRDLSSLIHGSLYLVPALLGRLGEVDFGSAGGDQIGPAAKGNRPTAQIVAVLEKFGARFPDPARLTGTWAHRRPAVVDVLDYSSQPHALLGPHVSGATKVAMLAALCVPGTSIIRHPVRKDAPLDLLAHLRRQGIADVLADGSWAIDGTHAQRFGGGHQLATDIAEAFTFAALAAHLDAPIVLDGLAPDFRAAFSNEEALLTAMGIGLHWQDDTLSLTRSAPLRGAHVTAGHDAVNTDVHPFCTLLLTGSQTGGSVTDEVWTHRFSYAEHLTDLGADLRVASPTVCVRPRVPHISGRTLRASDTRAVAVSILAALGIDGITRVEGVHHLERGYADLPGKLRRLGAVIATSGPAA